MYVDYDLNKNMYSIHANYIYPDVSSGQKNVKNVPCTICYNKCGRLCDEKV
jgi:hypothetical protein